MKKIKLLSLLLPLLFTTSCDNSSSISNTYKCSDIMIYYTSQYFNRYELLDADNYNHFNSSRNDTMYNPNVSLTLTTYSNNDYIKIDSVSKSITGEKKSFSTLYKANYEAVLL